MQISYLVCFFVRLAERGGGKEIFTLTSARSPQSSCCFGLPWAFLVCLSPLSVGGFWGRWIVHLTVWGAVDTERRMYVCVKSDSVRVLTDCSYDGSGGAIRMLPESRPRFRRGVFASFFGHVALHPLSLLSDLFRYAGILQSLSITPSSDLFQTTTTRSSERAI